MKKFNRFFSFFLILIALGTSAFVPVFAQDNTQLTSQNLLNTNIWGNGEVFHCDLLTDGLLFGTGLLLFGTQFAFQKSDAFVKPFDGNILDKNNVNVLDRALMRPYSKKIDFSADILVACGLVSPAILLFTEQKSDILTILMMYAEALVLSQGAKEFLKLCIDRPRPYMYFENYPEKDVQDFDWNKSCPSGHATMAFMSASYFSYVFCKYNPKNVWCYPVVIGSYALATTTAALRIASGNHFLTDVLFGAALGTGIGILVPWLHTITANKKSNENVQISALPLGVRICVNLD